LQPIDEMNFHLKRVNDDYSLEANSLVVGGEKVDGVLNIDHNSQKNRTTASLKLEGSLLSPRVWEQFTFVEQSPDVEVTWNYSKAETETYSLKLYADSLELPGVLFSNVHLDLQRLASDAHNNLVLNIKPGRMVTNEKFLENDYVSEILNGSVGIKGQLFTSDKTTVNFTGSDWQNLSFTVDSFLAEQDQKNSLHMILKGVTEQNRGVTSRLTLSNKNQNYKFDLTSTTDTPLVVKPL
jgi:hypothetical protein